MIARRDVALVAGRKDEIFAARTTVRAGDADIGNPFVPHVVDQPEHLGRNLEHQRSLARIEPYEVVDGVVVGGQFHGLGIDEVLPDHVGLVIGAELAQ